MCANKTKSTRVIVTGATGFIGRHMVDYLLERNHEVIATARDAQKAKLFSWFQHVRFIEHDLRADPASFDTPGDAALIHLAWQGLPNYGDLVHIEENLPIHSRFIKSLVSRGVRHVLVAGTCFEYGLQSGQIPSDAPTMPSNPYAIAKDSLRQYLEQLALKHPFTLQWARLFYMYGAGQNPKSLLAQLDAAIDSGATTFNMSGGEQLRDYLPVEAVVQQLFDLLERRAPGCFNVCSGKPISVRRLVERRLASRDATMTLNLGYYPYSEFEPMAFWGARDIGETVYLPGLPNAPFKDKNSENILAPMRLRKNSALEFLENAAFDPSLIDYSKNYENSQAKSDKFMKHMASVLDILKAHAPVGSLIVEVGCGKGDFVEMIQKDGYFNVKGYDTSYEGNNPVIEKRYLGGEDRLKADIIVLRHVLEHIPDPYSFLSTLKTIFGKAKIYIEVPSYDWIAKNKTFFDVTYEHVNYFSQASLQKMFDPSDLQHGLLLDDQYQYVVADISQLNPEFYRHYNSDDWQHVSFNEMFPNMASDIQRFDDMAKDKSVFLWGAATKGCLFLAHCKNQGKLIDKVKFAVDQNPYKVGKYLPGSLVEIKSKENFFSTAKAGDLLLVSNPAYKDEILSEIEKAGLKGVIVETL